MKTLPLDSSLPNVSPLVYGCMGLGGSANSSEQEALNQASAAIDAALEAGINYFDHADIYNGGKAEQVFGKLLQARPSLRDKIFLQSKCGIHLADAEGPKRFDFSRQWIQASVEGILSRLNLDCLDVLILHRPDPLMDGEEVADVFKALHDSGKVRHFGVSNMHRDQLAFLQSFLAAPLVVNQIELSLGRLAFIDEAIYAGQAAGSQLNFEAGTIEYCVKNAVQVQAWGSLCQGLFSGADLSQSPEHLQNTAALVASMADKYSASLEAIVLAWLRRHPANIQPVIGSVNPERIRACGEATNITLSHADWYALYVQARGLELP